MARLAALVLLAGSVGGGCHTALGSYLANRARDLGECVQIQTGLCLGLGGGVRAAGIAHAGIGGGFWTGRYALGWDYGFGHAFGAATGPADEFAFELYPPEPAGLPISHGVAFPFFSHVETRLPARGDTGSGSGHTCFLLLPGLLSFGDGGATWETEPASSTTWARVHAFDVGASVYAGVVFVSAGFSPGELLDFVLGWFGLDIAGDDRALNRCSKGLTTGRA